MTNTTLLGSIELGFHLSFKTCMFFILTCQNQSEVVPGCFIYLILHIDYYKSVYLSLFFFCPNMFLGIM